MENIKRFLADDSIFYGLLIGLVAVTAYGLGKHAALAPETAVATPAVSMVTKDVPKVEVGSEEVAEAQLVGSKNGTKYHFLTCPGASQIKDENKVFFDSIADARAAGYEPAGNCPGLQ